MIYGWHEQIQPGGAGDEYTLVFATLFSQDTVRIMPCRLSMLDETVETRPPWLDFSLSRPPCRAISVLHGHNSTVSRQLRYSLSRDCVSPTTPANRTISIQFHNPRFTVGP